MVYPMSGMDEQNVRLRAMLRNNKRSAAGSPAIGYGLKVGYWPCLLAPYAQIAFHRWRLDIWYGLPSYRDEGHATKLAEKLG
jgi:hypothetical protein